MAFLDLYDNRLTLKCSYDEKEKAKSFYGYKWDKKNKNWTYPCEIEIFNKINKTFGEFLIIEKRVIDYFKKEKEIYLQAGKIDMSIMDELDIKSKPYKYQLEGIKFLLQNPKSMLFDEMGCIANDTLVKINRGGNTQTYTIEQAYTKFHPSWDKRIISKIQSEQNGLLYLNDIIDIVYQGEKETIRVQAGSLSIEVTPDHEFLTPKGYIPANQLKKDFVVLVNGLKWCSICKKYTAHSRETAKFPNTCRICIYRFYRKNKNIKNGELTDKDGYIRMTKGIRYHPSIKNKKNKSGIPKHRLVYEAFINKVGYEEWLKIIEKNAFTEKHKFLDKKIIIHHKNEIKSDNKLSNLGCVSASEHHKIHKKEKNFGTFIPKPIKITNISKGRKTKVYDIKMKAPHHNFVANGFIIHNCGKSYQSMIASVIRKKLGWVNRVLIICPATVKRAVWAKEIEKHTHEKYIVIEGTKLKRKNLLREYKDDQSILFLIMNYEAMLKTPPSLKFDCIILDESVRIKNPKAQTTKIIKKMTALFKICLSGYPIANRVIDIWSQVDWIRPGYLGDKWTFLDQYTTQEIIKLKPQYDANGDLLKAKEFKQQTGYKNLNELYEKLKPLYIRRLKKDVLDLPPKIYETREVKLKPQQQKLYDRMKEDMKIMIEGMDARELQFKAPTLLVQLLRLSQIADGFITDPLVDGVTWLSENAKLSCIDELVDELTLEDNKCVIWSRFVPMVKKLYERYKEKYNAVYITGSVKMDDRADMIDKFQNDPTSKVFIGQIQSGGIGITLTAANYEIFVDKAFLSPSYILQAEDRCHRISQTKTVVIISIVAKNTVDEKWESLIKEKRKVAEHLLGDIDPTKLAKKDFLELLN